MTPHQSSSSPSPSRPATGDSIWRSLATAAIAAIVAIAIQANRQERVAADILDPVVEQEQLAVRLALLERLPSLGFDNLIADWTFMQYLQYFGDEAAREKTGCRLNATYLDIITERDARFLGPYLFVPSGVSYCQGEPQQSVELLDRGVTAIDSDLHDNAFIVPLLEALDRLLLLGDVDGAIAAYETAAERAANSDRFTELAPRLRDRAEFLRRNPRAEEARFLGWQEVYNTATDDRVRERAIAELKELGVQVVRQEDGSVQFIPPDEFEL